MKVTNAAMDKKWCIVVNTEGRSGSVKKKYLERVEPGRIHFSTPSHIPVDIITKMKGKMGG